MGKKKVKLDIRCEYCGKQENSEEMIERLYLYEDDGKWQFECPNCESLQPYKSKCKFNK